MAGPGFSDEVGGPIDSSTFAESKVDEEKRRALEEPGASWKEWLYFTAFKWWFAIVFLIIDSWIVTIFLEARSWIPLAVATVVAVYLELLLYSYLWRRPDPHRAEPGRRRGGSSQRFGRWTPEAFRQRAAQAAGTGGEAAPDPREFL